MICQFLLLVLNLLSMADGIENAAAVCCFITSKYQGSPYCKKELLYAENCRIPLIPCLMDSDPQWMPTSWLGYSIIDILYLDFRDLLTDNSPENIETKCNMLIERIASTLGRTPSISSLYLSINVFIIIFLLLCRRIQTSAHRKRNNPPLRLSR
jgi:hypothetical protein